MADSDQKSNNPEQPSDEQRELKNAIFAAKAAAETGGIGLNKTDYAKREMGIEIPVDAVPLPSKGKVYPVDHPLHGADQVEYRAMTAKEEDILMSPAYLKKGTVITELIKSCLTNPDIDVNSLLSGDRNALMIAIRSSGYGRDYNPVYVCPNCEFKNEMTIDLSELGIKPLNLDPVNPGENLFAFTLPNTGKTVVFRFLTGKEEEEIIAEVEMKKKKGLLNSNIVTARLQRSIVAVNNSADRSFVSKFVQYMPAKDSLALREYIDEHEPGVDMMVPFTCKNCDHFEEVTLPMGPTFFWPNARR